MTPLAQLMIDEGRTGTSCVAENGFCPGWIADNWQRYLDPLWQHIFLVLTSLGLGFAIATSVGLLAHRHRWLLGPGIAITTVLFTVPSLAAFFLLLPLTGRGPATGIIALTAYTLTIIFRNTTTGLDNVPEEVVDAARGQGLTERQVLWRVEVPLAVPDILAGLRIAASTTVGFATLAFFAGAGGLGEPIYRQIEFQSNVVVAGGLCVLLAASLDLLALAVQRLATPWTRVRAT